MEPNANPNVPPVVEKNETNTVKDMKEMTTPVSAMAQPEKKKNKTGMIAGIVCLALLAVAGLSFGAYAMITKDNAVADAVANCEGSNNDNVEIVETTCENSVTTITVTKNNSEQAEVKEIVKKVYDNLTSNINAVFELTFGDGSLIKLVGTNVKTDTYTNSDESYGLSSWGSYYNKELENKVMQESYNYVKATLEANGYSNVLDSMGGQLFYNSSTKIYCDASTGSLPYSMNCSKENWISDENKKLVAEFSTALGDDTYGPKFVAIPNNFTINNSEVSPYQNTMVYGMNAALLFYRTSPSAEWIFFRGTQAELACSDYSGDTAKAFAGEVCWDTETNQQSTVQPDEE